MIYDRGRIKWNSLMLPEHVKMLREWAKEETADAPKQIDEQQFEVMNKIAQEAIRQQKFIQVTYMDQRRYKNCIGMIRRYHPSTQAIEITNQFKETIYVPVEKIVHIHLK